jgi:hypothetical protein
MQSLFKILEFDVSRATDLQFSSNSIIGTVYQIIYNYNLSSKNGVKKKYFPLIMAHFKRGVFQSTHLISLMLDLTDAQLKSQMTEFLTSEFEKSNSSFLEKSYYMNILTKRCNFRTGNISLNSVVFAKMIQLEQLVR